MGVSNLKKRKIGYILLACVVSLLTLRQYGVIIYNDFGRWLQMWKEVSYLGSLSPEEWKTAYHPPKDMLNKESNIILHWTPIFGEFKPLGPTSNGCIMTYNRSAIGIAKAVVFHFSDMPPSLPLGQRKDWQRWVWFCMEPPWNTRYLFHERLTPLNGVFNWTMTYRHDSDLLASYAEELPPRENRTVAEMIKEKTAKPLGIWLVSNCHSKTRMKFIKELQKYVDIDVRGRCTGVPLCRGQCAYDAIRTYKFYFSFENSRCKEYITEKFFRQGLLGGAVPVVMGPPRSDYEKMAPPNSFIHVDNFKTAKRLAEYLQELDENDAKYGEYLRWRSIPDAPGTEYKPNVVSSWITLCDKLKNETIGPKTITNLDTYWFGEGYNEFSTKFSVCHPEDGPSDHNPYRYLVLECNVFITVCCLLTVLYCQSRTNA